MTALISDYICTPGEHCGSTAMRNLLRYYCDLDLTEAEVFGLGSGIDCVIVSAPTSAIFKPSQMVMGRSVTMEVDVASALGVDYRETPDLDNERAWAVVKAEVDAGRPTMLSGDVFHLDYRDFRVHFPAHRFVLLGYDEVAGVAVISDRLQAELDRCGLEALARSRNPTDAISTFNLWGRFHDTEVKRSLEEAMVVALRRTARRMTGGDDSQAVLIQQLGQGTSVTVKTGLAALEVLPQTVATWRDRPDGLQVARFAAACIEKFGTGGGMFRTLFADFLKHAKARLGERVDDGLIEQAKVAAEAWTRLAGALAGASSNEVAWDVAVSSAQHIADTERALFANLAEVFP